MRVSYPELLVLCERVLQVKGFPLGSMVEGAEMIAWAEIVRFNGLKRLLVEMERFEEVRLDAIQIVSESPHLTILNGANQPDLLSARVAADLAYAKACMSGMGVVEVINCQGNPWVGQNAYQIAMRGTSCMIDWGNQIAIADPDDHEHPRLMEDSSNTEKPHHIFIICSKSSFQIDMGYSEIRSPKQIQTDWNEAIHHGVEVDPEIWKRLMEISSEVLVESTERSRLKGTGEQA